MATRPATSRHKLHSLVHLATPALVFTRIEIQLLDHLVKSRRHKQNEGNPTVSHYLTQLARPGGYLYRTGDPPPGNKMIWRGMLRLTDIEPGFLIGAKFVGN